MKSEKDNFYLTIFSVYPEPVQQLGGYIDSSPVVHTHLYLPLPTRNPLYKVSAATPTHNLLQSVSKVISCEIEYYLTLGFIILLIFKF